MDEFLKKHLSLINKNLIMTIHVGRSDCENVFNKQRDKYFVNNLLYNIKKYKYRIHHTTCIKEYRNNNSIYCTYNNNIDIVSYNNIDTLQLDNLHLEVQRIFRDTFIPESVSVYDSADEYDMMTININNTIDINICDYKSYYTANIVLKKPVTDTLLKSIINDLTVIN